jgi:hypothetical protein
MDHVRNFRLIDVHNHIYGLSDGPCPQCFRLLDGHAIYGLSDFSFYGRSQ